MNPSFPIDIGEARTALDEMRSSPIRAERPIVILAGYQDPGIGASGLARRVRRSFIDAERVIAIDFFGVDTFDECRDRVIREVQASFPGSDPEFTEEVDVIGISMGGLVARHAARQRGEGDEAGRRLRVARLFTIATPHRGARLANLPTFDPKMIDMRRGSEFIEELNADPTTSDFPIVAYGRLEDAIVGVGNSAPPDAEPWWVPNRPFHLSHITSASDPRIVADILRRLRNEEPLTRGAPTPAPNDS